LLYISYQRGIIAIITWFSPGGIVHRTEGNIGNSIAID